MEESIINHDSEVMTFNLGESNMFPKIYYFLSVINIRLFWMNKFGLNISYKIRSISVICKTGGYLKKEREYNNDKVNEQDCSVERQEPTRAKRYYIARGSVILVVTSSLSFVSFPALFSTSTTF